MFDKFKKKNAVQRLLEEKLYEKVIQEMSQGYLRDGIWGKALANSNGSNEKAKALYIKFRVQSMKDEFELSELMTTESEIGTKKQAEIIQKEIGKESFSKNILNKSNEVFRSKDCIESLEKSEIDWLNSLSEKELKELIFETHARKEYAVCKIYLEWIIRKYPESRFIDFIARDRLRKVNSMLGI